MNIDLLHNKIMECSVSHDFKRSVEQSLVPMLESEYGDDIFGMLMYEDHIAADPRSRGYWYYPLTVFTTDGASIRWIRWNVSDASAFKNGNPYSYKGSEPITFSFVDEVPESIAAMMDGKAYFYDANSIPVKVCASVQDMTVLSGKYSQGFLDEMSRQLTEQIERVMGVGDFSSSTVELRFTIADGTYMEHTNENVTYRRLGITARGCQPRDFWVKWTRLDHEGAYTAADDVSFSNIMFEIGEEVPRKIREKEYRHLALTEPDKYDAAMSKRAATAWREIIKLALKRAELTRYAQEPATARVTRTERTAEQPVVPVAEPKMTKAVTESMPTSDESMADVAESVIENSNIDEASAQLMRVIGDMPRAEAVESDDNGNDDDGYDDIVAMAMAALNASAPKTETEAEQPTMASDEDGEFALSVEHEEDDVSSVDEDAALADFIYSASFADAEENTTAAYDEGDIVGSDIDSDTEENTADSDEQLAETKAKVEQSDEERIRTELEERIRREMEEKAREQEKALREESERLRRENERLVAAARESEEQRRRERELAAMREEEERLARERREKEAREEEQRRRAALEEQQRRDAEERARFAEAARAAVEQQRRIEAERAANEARAREQAIRAERDRLLREDEARRAEERRRDEERRRAEEAKKAVVPPPVEYMSKRAKLIFGRNFDPNILGRIKEIVEETLVAKNKGDIHIHIKAYPVDSYTINLDIMKIPVSEKNLLVSIIKAIGNSKIGVTKITVE